MSTDDPKKREQMRAEYAGRINRVIDHIQSNLSEDLTLEQLARVSNFSRFHFHRIFGAMMGETLNRYIARLRVEKAASMLLSHRDASITEVALDCGYSSSATFSRAFREAFDMTPSEWRSGGFEDRKIRKTKSKLSQPVRKPSTELELVSLHYESQTDTTVWRMKMKKTNPKDDTFTVEVKHLPEMHVAYVRHIGPYAGYAKVFEDLFGRLMKWAGPRGYFRPPETKMLSVYYDDPNITEEEKLRVDGCITVPPDAEVEGEVGKATIPAGQYAVGHFEVGPQEFTQAWEQLMGGWLPESGYQPNDGPCFELYLNDAREHPENKCIVDICVPVRPM